MLTWFLYGYALAMPVTIVVSEPLAFASFPVWLYLLWRGEAKPLERSPFFWPIILFVGAVLISCAFGIRPSLSFRKLDRLLLLGVIFVMPALFRADRDDSWKAAWLLVTLFVAGAAIKATYDVIRIPYALMQPYVVDPEMPLIYKLGNMREPQIYAVALCLIIGALVHGEWSLKMPAAAAALVLNAAGLILHFKRGAWMAFVLAVVIMGLATRSRKVILIMGLCVLSLLALPQVRHRVGMVENEFSQRFGGRMKLWTRAAPRLISAHPMGIGWRAVKHEDLKGVTRHVQSGLNHMHDNILQVTVETGWLGLAAWLNWMGTVLYILWTSYRRSKPVEAGAAAMSLGLLGGFCAVMLNGVVEYNFGDAEIFMVLCFLMGMSGIVVDRLRARPEGRLQPPTQDPATEVAAPWVPA
ncbi:MAG TPA: O-antigen ligase family protein [Kiritimatiellia bacterium]